MPSNNKFILMNYVLCKRNKLLLPKIKIKMVSKTRLYDAFGELLYTVAIADGIIQEEEIKIIEEKLEEYDWGDDVKWSFKYEMKKGSDLKDTYLKALDTFKEYGPHPDYYNLIELLEEVAKASDGFEKKEGRVISIFNKSLRAHFLEYITENRLKR